LVLHFNLQGSFFINQSTILGLLGLQFLNGQEYALSDSIQLLLDFTFFYTILTSWITTVGAIAIKSQPYGIKVFLAHFFASIPYTLCKMVITLVAWYDHIARETSWVVTPRQKSKYEEKVTHSYDVANPRYAQK